MFLERPSTCAKSSGRGPWEVTYVTAFAIPIGQA